MAPDFFRLIGAVALGIFTTITPATGQAEPTHGIAMYGAPALPHDFVSLPYADVNAPKGGAIIFGEPGTFDSLNGWIRRGTAPWAVQAHVSETLMGRSIDEPFSLYGLLAESIEVPDDRSWVEFTLREEARFSDNSPVTVEDVMWSYETLGTLGHPRYHSAWRQVETMEQTGPRSVRFTFNTDNRELALLMGMRPILQKAQWEGRDFSQSGFDVVPIGSSPYVIDRVDPGRSIRLKRNPDYWGKDLPFMQGLANFDEIRYEYFGDGDVVFEAFKAGEINSYREASAAKWAQRYDFPAVANGDVIKSLIPHQQPSGIRGFVMNSRRAPFDDWRVREAMLLAFNYDYISETINADQQPRITSYFSNSVLGMQQGPADPQVAAMLAPYDDLPEGTLEGYALPQGDGTARNRANIGRAMELLAQAGYSAEDGVMRDAEGAPLTFTILLKQGNTEAQNIIDIFVQALARLGIQPKVTVVDSAQYVERTNSYDFDMAYYLRRLSLSPGNEQRLYWGSEAANQQGTSNWMGVQSAAVDGLIETMLSAQDQDDFRNATRALDRVLTAGRYVIPLWYSDHSMLAHRKELHHPARLPLYGDAVGFQPDVWWYSED